MLSSYGIDDELRKQILRKVNSSKDQFEREEFNAWGLKIMKDVIDNPNFFGDKYRIDASYCYMLKHHYAIPSTTHAELSI